MRALSILSAGLLLLVPAATQDPVPGDDAAHGTALERHMEDMQVALKALRRSVREADQSAESLGHVHALQTAILLAKLETPALAETLPESERPALTAAYREDMARLLAKTCELEIAVLQGDVERARELHKAIADTEEPGHSRFTEGG